MYRMPIEYFCILDRLLRSDIVYLACASNISDCLGTAATKLESWIVDAAYPLPLDTRRQVWITAICFDNMWRLTELLLNV